eukprot:CAMPEP_0113312682 /NCGR_PEP_ID=MMETSP0010_2-20120614/9418_1 /TAXON_ID=216773 ORGANISM="Corethron hystrix, Strain 308" /NCGR_SAMPLE_ID=MMETSP0010_2 /ASSEMBLY_ACC=CAM_ASM_000155 /LENGTH=481 /DNA_ID=CAMNT_0000168563 /DNA_START=513 /DNA_END=1958 /DNA_ORIENTATION=+ /assembly_acc=CAM_ASM_000155
MWGEGPVAGGKDVGWVVDEHGRRIRAGAAKEKQSNDNAWDDEYVAPSPRRPLIGSKSSRSPSSQRNGRRGGSVDTRGRFGDARGGNDRDRNRNRNRDRGGDERNRDRGDRRRGDDGGRWEDSRNGGRRGNDGEGRQRLGEGRARRNGVSTERDEERINLRALEADGWVHLYGVAPVLNALSKNKRQVVAHDVDDGGDVIIDAKEASKKPEAQSAPYLFVQEGENSGRSVAKREAVQEIWKLADEKGVKVAMVDKGVLNSLCGNRPHQGYVLRCGSISFPNLSTLPDPVKSPNSPSLWLALDEVVDPQNFGALLRSAYFLGGGTVGKKIGIIVCSKNSAPPSAVVSAASAGALELAEVYSTRNMPRLLSEVQDGAAWRILGAAAELPVGVDDGVSIDDLRDIGPASRAKPTILVLGSEGSGLRTLVARQCTKFVRIEGMTPISDVGDDFFVPSSSVAGVDSLNVSVSGGILLWHLAYGMCNP